MARSSLKRKRRASKTWAEIESRRLFVDAARSQRCCACCGGAGDFDAHHVVERQYLRQNHLPQFDSRNALRLCTDCHHGHTIRSRKLTLAYLTDENIEYAVMLLGADRADLVLRRWYEGDDPRLELALATEQAETEVEERAG